MLDKSIVSYPTNNGQKTKQFEQAFIPQDNDNRISELCELYSWLISEWIKHLALATIYRDGEEGKVKHLTLAKMAQTWIWQLERKNDIKIGE